VDDYVFTSTGVTYTASVTPIPNVVTIHNASGIAGLVSAGEIFGFLPAGGYSIRVSSSTNAPYTLSFACTGAPLAPPPQPIGCGASTPSLCLLGNRFRVEASWRVPSQGTSGIGHPVDVTSDTGQFWFFSSNNIELVVKVLDGRAVNGRYWVFFGALSDVEYTIAVTDTISGAIKTYTNPQGHLGSVADTSAF
jgi:hypothetical protein